HRVVVRRLFGGVHHLGLEDAREHREANTLDRSGTMRVMKRAAFALAIVLSVPAAALSAPNENEKDKNKKTESTYDPENVIAISQYMDTVAKGAEKYKKSEYPAAIDLFKKAIQLAPKNPLAHMLLGEAYLGAENLPEAEAAFLAARDASTS